MTWRHFGPTTSMMLNFRTWHDFQHFQVGEISLLFGVTMEMPAFLWLLMEEVLHHLGCINLVNHGSINWCRTSSVNRMFRKAFEIVEGNLKVRNILSERLISRGTRMAAALGPQVVWNVSFGGNPPGFGRMDLSRITFALSWQTTFIRMLAGLLKPDELKEGTEGEPSLDVRWWLKCLMMIWWWWWWWWWWSVAHRHQRNMLFLNGRWMYTIIIYIHCYLCIWVFVLIPVENGWIQEFAWKTFKEQKRLGPKSFRKVTSKKQPREVQGLLVVPVFVTNKRFGGYRDYMGYGGFLKWWYPTTMGFPTKNDHF